MSSNLGWTCPKCGVVNAPIVMQCSCTPVRKPIDPQSKSVLDGIPIKETPKLDLHTKENPNT